MTLEDFKYLPWRICEFFRRRWLDFKWACQRFYKGHADCDFWNIDTSFCRWIIPVLKQYKVEHHCWPSEFWKAGKGPEDWLKVIDRMIYGFEIYLKDQEEGEFNPQTQKEVKKSLRLFTKYFTELWD